MGQKRSEGGRDRVRGRAGERARARARAGKMWEGMVKGAAGGRERMRGMDRDGKHQPIAFSHTPQTPSQPLPGSSDKASSVRVGPIACAPRMQATLGAQAFAVCHFDAACDSKCCCWRHDAPLFPFQFLEDRHSELCCLALQPSCSLNGL